MARKLLGVDHRDNPGTADTQPPTVPGTFVVSAITTTTATVAWNASTDPSGVDHYNVYNATPTSGGGPVVPVLLGVVDQTPLTAAPLFGTLVTQTAHAATEFAAGSTQAMLELNWASYETADGVFSASYITSIQAQLAALQAAGMPVTLAMGIHHPPAWALAMANSKQIDQTGAVTGQIDTIFNKQIRAKVEAYLTKINTDLGFANFWAVRLTSGGNAEMLHPGGNSYWAYGPNAQNGTDMPSTMDANPFPGWVAGGADHSITTAQVRTWATWYVDALVDVTAWQMTYLAGLGFRGYYQTLTPGSGRRPSVFTSDVNNYLPNSTTGVGAVWDIYYANLRSRAKVIVYVSSVADGSGNDDFTQPGDHALALTDTTMNAWSATRWQTRIGFEHSMLVGGENPGYTTGGAPHYTDLTDAGLLAHSFAQLNGCGLYVFYWAHDDRLWDGTLPFANYAAKIAATNAAVGGTVVNVFPNPDCISGGTAFATSNTTVVMGSTEFAASGVGSAKVTVGGSPTTSTFGYPAVASGDAADNGHLRYTAAVGDTFDFLFTVKAHASNTASVNILPKVVGYHWNGSANVASTGGEANGTAVLLAAGATAVVAQRITVATPPTDPIDGVLLIPHIRSGTNVASAPAAAQVIYLDRMAAVRNSPRILTTTDWFDGASPGASWSGSTNLSSSTGPITGSTGSLSFNLTGLPSGQDNTIWVTAVDGSPQANESDPGAVTVTTTSVPDTTAPSVPTGLTAGTITSTSLSFTWSPSTDEVGGSGLDHYVVLRGGTAIAGATPTDTTYTDTGRTASTAYTYTVKAVDAAGNVSSASSGLTMTTDSGLDSTAPSQVLNLAAANVISTQTGLTWDAATDNVAVTGYKVYWNTGGTGAATTLLHTKGNVLSDTAKNLTADTDYRFAVSALDAAGNEGAKSGTITVHTDVATGGIFFGINANSDSAKYPTDYTTLGGRTAAAGHDWSSTTPPGYWVDANQNGTGVGITRGYSPGGLGVLTPMKPGQTTGGKGTNVNQRHNQCWNGSFSPQEMVNGLGDAEFMAFINSIAAGWDYWLTYRHEPNSKFNTTDYTPALYKSAYQRIGALIEGRAMPSGQVPKNGSAAALSLNAGVTLQTALCFTIPHTSTGAGSNHWDQVQLCIPQASTMDARAILLLDAYQNPPPGISQVIDAQHPTLVDLYPTPGSIWNFYFNNVHSQFGYDTGQHGYGIGEWNAPLRDNDPTGAGQGAAMNNYLNFLEGQAAPPNGPGQPKVLMHWYNPHSIDTVGATYNQSTLPPAKQAIVTHAIGKFGAV